VAKNHVQRQEDGHPDALPPPPDAGEDNGDVEKVHKNCGYVKNPVEDDGSHRKDHEDRHEHDPAFFSETDASHFSLLDNMSIKKDILFISKKVACSIRKKSKLFIWEGIRI